MSENIQPRSSWIDHPWLPPIKRCLGFCIRRWPATLRSFAGLRRLFIDLVIIISIGTLTIAVCKAVYKSNVIVDAITVPKALEDKGITGKGVAQTLVDDVVRIGRKANTNKDKVEFGTVGLLSDASSIKVASTGIDIGTLVSLLRDFLSTKTSRVTGELAIQSEDGTTTRPSYILTLHLANGDHRTHSVEQQPDLAKVIELSARKIMEEFDGYTFAVYAWRYEDAQVDELLDRLFQNLDKDDLKWVRTLQGIRLKEAGDYEGAIRMYKEAIVLDPNFANAHDDWGTALAKQGRYPEAFEKYKKATDDDGSYVTAYYHWGAALNADKKPADAKVQFNKVISADPDGRRHPYYKKLALVALGNNLLDGGASDEAIEQYRKAIDFERTFARAYNNWAVALLCQDKDNIDSAVKLFRTAVRYKSGFGEAEDNLSRAIAAQNNKELVATLCMHGKEEMERCSSETPGCPD